MGLNRNTVYARRHGVYDNFDNVGFMALVSSYHSSAFVYDAIPPAWLEDRCRRYPNAEEIALTSGSGGANAASLPPFKKESHRAVRAPRSHASASLAARLTPRSGTRSNTACSVTSSGALRSVILDDMRPDSRPLNATTHKPIYGSRHLAWIRF